MAFHRWKRTNPSCYERWHPWRMSVERISFEWWAWVQGRQVVPIRYLTRREAMTACERLTFEEIQRERKKRAFWREWLREQGDAK